MRKLTFPLVEVKAGSRWQEWRQTLRTPQGCWSEPLRVMAVAEGYAMCRFPRCVPFVVHVREFADTSRYRPAEKQRQTDTQE